MATILLGDDDAGLLGSLGILIAAEGPLVRTATNGGDALRLALESRPDIVVIDCAMPGMDGIALVRKLQQYPELASLPVILTSDARRRPHIKVLTLTWLSSYPDFSRWPGQAKNRARGTPAC